MNDTDALLVGRLYDPHRILGVHVDGSHTIIRVFKPGASKIIARTPSARITLERTNGDLFEGALPDMVRPLNYELEVSYWDGTQQVELDPYGYPPTVGELDLYFLGEGQHAHLEHALGARPYSFGDIHGTAFSVWAPSALAVSLIGDFNAWNSISLPMRSLGASGVWELFMPGVVAGAFYKFSVLGSDEKRREKADPLALATEIPPSTASMVWTPNHQWNDDAWLAKRKTQQPWQEPISIYEIHLGSWRYDLSYTDLADQIGIYASDLGFTHVELMPIMEHPFGGSWGYQVSGFFAPTSRFGSPDDFMAFVDTLHGYGLGVIFDWVPGHFPRDEWALARFDGTALYEHADVRRGSHPDWGTLVFNHGRNEVRNFLISSARRWCNDFHGDGLRVDAVASMLYLDYSRRSGEWIPNRYGGREDLEALSFLRELNTTIYEENPGTMTIAEESTSWPGVSKAVSDGGLGFGFKWNMGWMHDTLEYFSHDPIHRRYHHNELTFASIYSFSENFVLPLSHDEVVHGKRSLLAKMPGDRWQQLANLRALYGFMWAHPGKKLLFMGGEFAQVNEWNHNQSLDWHLLDDPNHAGVTNLIRDLNRVYRDEAALWELDTDPQGFRWISGGDADHNTVAFLRVSKDDERQLVCVCNLSPVPRDRYRLGVPRAGQWNEIVNTDSSFYGGSDVGNHGSVTTTHEAYNDFEFSVELTLPPLATIWLVPDH